MFERELSGMNYRFLGRTGLRISTLGLGTMTFGGSGSAFFEGVGGVESTDAQYMFDMALDSGVNFVDTADVYSRGVSEEILGKIIKDKRNQVIIATKCHGRMSTNINDIGLSRQHIISSCEASMSRLGTDFIDLYQVHGFDAYTSWDEALSTFDTLVRQGKVRHIGCSNLSAWHVMKALGVSERYGWSRFAAYQGNYSLLAREAEHELLPMCGEEGLAFIVWSPLAGGYLSGKYVNAGASVQGRRSAVGDPGTIDGTTATRILKVLEEIATAHGRPFAQVSLNYLTRKTAIASVLVGSRTLAQFEENLKCLEWSLSDEEAQRLDDASARPLPYPYWHQRQYNASRFSR